MKIGILYPRSDAHPGMTIDYLDGIKTALNHEQLNDKIQLVSESIGFGGNDKEVYEKTEKLLVLEGVDMLVAYIDLRILEILKPLLYTSGKLVLAVNPGANYLQDWTPQPNILNLTLQHGFLCWLTGILATRLNYSKAAMATSFYDCGYLHTAAMVKGFVKPGGNIAYNYVNNQRYNDLFDIKQLTDYLSSDNVTDSLLCILDSLPASLLYSKLNACDEAGNLHLFVSPMMLEQKALENMIDGFKFSVDGYIPWHISLENNANKAFKDNYNRQTKRNANIFSLLGWETGMVIKKVFTQCNKEYADVAAIVGKLSESNINSPRGEIKLDPKTNYFIASVCKCSIKQKSGKLIVDWMEIPEKEWNSFVNDPTEGASSGWTNTYLCY